MTTTKEFKTRITIISYDGSGKMTDIFTNKPKQEVENAIWQAMTHYELLNLYDEAEKANVFIPSGMVENLIFVVKGEDDE